MLMTGVRSPKPGDQGRSSSICPPGEQNPGSALLALGRLVNKKSVVRASFAGFRGALIGTEVAFYPEVLALGFFAFGA